MSLVSSGNCTWLSCLPPGQPDLQLSVWWFSHGLTKVRTGSFSSVVPNASTLINGLYFCFLSPSSVYRLPDGKDFVLLLYPNPLHSAWSVASVWYLLPNRLWFPTL